MPKLISTEQVDAYRIDGAVFLPGLLTDWVDTIRAGIERNMREPGPYAAENLKPGEGVVGPHAPVAAAPSHHVVTVMASDSLARVLERLQETPDSVAVVIDHGGPVGLLTEETLIAYLDQARTTV